MAVNQARNQKPAFAINPGLDFLDVKRDAITRNGQQPWLKAVAIKHLHILETYLDLGGRFCRATLMIGLDMVVVHIIVKVWGQASARHGDEERFEKYSREHVDIEDLSYFSTSSMMMAAHEDLYMKLFVSPWL